MVERRRAIRGDRVATGDADPLRSLAAGLHELELPFRATLELRYRRGLDDETIAAVAQFGQDEVQRQRRRALVWLAQRTGTRGPDAIEVVERGLSSLTPAAWAGEPEPAPEPPPEDEPEPEPEPEYEPGPVPESEPEPEPVATQPLAVSVPPPHSPSGARPVPQPKPFPTPAKKQVGPASPDARRRLLGLFALLAAVVALFLVITSGGDDDSGSASAPPVTESKGSGGEGGKGDGATPAAEAVTMEFVPGAEAAGEVEVSMSGAQSQPDIEINLNGLAAPEGEYRGWLYNSVIDSRSLGRARSGDGVISATLPEGWQDYGFIDLSLQEPESIAHSGRSVARIAIGDLPTP